MTHASIGGTRGVGGTRARLALLLLVEAVVAGLTPTAVVVMTHALRLAWQFQDVGGVRLVAGSWALGSGAVAGVGVACGIHVVATFARAVRSSLDGRRRG